MIHSFVSPLAVLVRTGLFVILSGCAFQQPLDRSAEKRPPTGTADVAAGSPEARESQAAGAAIYHAAQLLTGEARRKSKPTLVTGQCFVQSAGNNILTPCPRMQLHLLSEDGQLIRKILVKNGSFSVDIRGLKTFQLIPASDQYKAVSDREIGSEHLSDARGLKIRLIRARPNSEAASPK